MSKVLVDRELLEVIEMTWRVPHPHAGCFNELGQRKIEEGLCKVRAILEAQPAEVEGADLQRLAAEFDAAPDDAEWEPPHPIFQMARDLDRVTAALSAVTAERDALAARLGEWERSKLAQIMRENVELTAERDRLESMLIRTATRHFALQIKDRADDKKLDECLSEGIAMLEAERDRLRDAAGKAIAWLDAEQNGSGVGINRRIKLCRDAENSLRAAMAAKEG